jgi:hypothetical protein
MDEGLESRKIGKKDDGVFATRSFTPNETVLVGVIEGVLPKNDSHASQVGLNEFVRHGGLMPKVNHSCSPNCGIKAGNAGAHNIVARRSITAGEEISFDYAMRNLTIDWFPSRCLCGTPECRGQITGWKDLPDERKAAYRGFVAPYLLDIDLKVP